MDKHTKTRRRLIAGLVAMFGATALVATSAAATGPATVTGGNLAPFAAGVGGSTSGHAQMVRTASGSTIVSLHVEGLRAGGQYASHVHAAACGVGEADGHYKLDPAGLSVPPNEIWLGGGPFTADLGGIANVRAVADYVAGVTAVSVVVHDLSLPSTANKIACADLG